MSPEDSANAFIASQEEREAAIMAIKDIENVDYEEAVRIYEKRFSLAGYDDYEED